ncbi:hypothetical protein ND860_18035 [Leptospira levettii]|uniref:hypothetical protein n=1 Tax=Leptospira levettii TaxID=2023178 RepID=UPI00223C9480|nr:hypothetical protein [Leptospira levettii]MCW7498441.1 hypothetical protein [Leptospira levettii]
MPTLNTRRYPNSLSHFVPAVCQNMPSAKPYLSIFCGGGIKLGEVIRGICLPHPINAYYQTVKPNFSR